VVLWCCGVVVLWCCAILFLVSFLCLLTTVTICVGFSIDFVAHLAVAYNESEDTKEGRYGKVKQALSELGISVTAAAITTCGASVFMIPNYMTPFVKIGMFICFDIIVSLLFAVFMFAGMLRLCGPKDRNHCRIDVVGLFRKGTSTKVSDDTDAGKEKENEAENEEGEKNEAKATTVEMTYYVNPGNTKDGERVPQVPSTSTEKE
jgi:hypothetical protein